jgi:hypothetical protein
MCRKPKVRTAPGSRRQEPQGAAVLASVSALGTAQAEEIVVSDYGVSDNGTP